MIKIGSYMGKKVKVKIKELIKLKGISLRELSRLTDIRHAALSELASSKRQNINFNHIEKIADEFDISDIREIIELVDIKEK
jgi:putative transcriptional regulator